MRLSRRVVELCKFMKEYNRAREEYVREKKTEEFGYPVLMSLGKILECGEENESAEVCRSV